MAHDPSDRPDARRDAVLVGTDGAPVVQVWARDGARTELSPGALDMLRLLGPGRRIELIRGDGRRDRWSVVATEAHGDPVGSDLVLVDEVRGELTLVVCGGAYRPDLAGYERPLRLHCRPDGATSAAA